MSAPADWRTDGTPTVLIPVPQVRPFGIPVTAGGVQDVWETFVVAQQDGPQSVEMRVLMAILRAVNVGLEAAEVTA